jgi:hypothetical protein
VHAQILAVVFINASVRAGLSSQIDEGIAPAIGDRLEPFLLAYAFTSRACVAVRAAWRCWRRSAAPRPW